MARVDPAKRASAQDLLRDDKIFQGPEKMHSELIDDGWGGMDSDTDQNWNTDDDNDEGTLIF